MVEILVIDASALAAFLLREPEGRTLDKILIRVESGHCELHAPVLLGYEIANILAMAERKGRIPSQLRTSLLRDWDTIPITEHSSFDAGIRGRILALASQHKLSAYDAAYLELAQRLSGQLVTLDGDLLSLRRTYPWIC